MGYLPTSRTSFSEPFPSSANLRPLPDQSEGFSFDNDIGLSQWQNQTIENPFQWRIASLQHVVIRQNHDEPAVRDDRLDDLQEATMFTG
jgi:hypothetical protein